MGFYYLQGGTSLQKLNASGATITTLTLPSGVTLSSTRPPRFATLGEFVVMVNSPDVNLLIDSSDDTVRRMSPLGPLTPASLAAGTGTGLTGAYRVKYSFLIKDSFGRVVAESPMSQESSSLTLSNTGLRVNGIAISPDSVINSRRVYRTVAGGAVYFHLIDLDGNTDTNIDDNMTDARLSLLPAPTTLGNPPGTSVGSGSMELIAAWKGRLWGRGRVSQITIGTPVVDILRWSEVRKPAQWPDSNTLPIPPVGADEFGITAIIPRRDVLGIAKRDSLWIITDPNPTEGSLRAVVNGVGCVAPDSVVVIHDVAFWLGEDGIYKWDNDGVRNISKEQVDPWFTTTTYFNRAEFVNAKARWDPVRGTYDLLMAGTGQTTLNRWISYYLRDKVFFGIHRTAAFTPSAIGFAEDPDDLARPLIGSTSGFLWRDQATRTDSTATAIDADMTLPFFSGNTPDIQKVWLQPTILTVVEAAGTLTVTPTVGGLNTAAGAGRTHTLTTGRERLGRLGIGRLCRLRLQQNTAAQDVTLYGIELPYEELGRR